MTKRKTIEDLTRPYFEGKWLNDYYILNTCPFCRGKSTLRFYGNGCSWECFSCKTGGGPKEMKSLLANRKDAAKYDGLFDNLEEPADPDGLVVVSRYNSPVQVKRIDTGFKELDMLTNGLPEGTLSILTGKQGEGKSTFAGQMALNAVNDGFGVCFYSGELSSGIFKHWIYSQAAGPNWMNEVTDRFGKKRHVVDDMAKQRISKWLGEKLILYDNTANNTSETDSIIKRFMISRRIFGSSLFFVDNLMTAKIDINRDKDFFRAQANFVGDLISFAQQERVHVVLIAHPGKADYGDPNDNVAGLGDVTRRSSIIMTMHRMSEAEKATENCDNLLVVSKNREYGEYGKIKFNFNVASKRMVPQIGEQVKYKWEEEL